MGLFMERETEAWKGPRPIQGHTACERQSQGLNSAWPFLEPVLLPARPGAPWGCCPEVSRQVLRSNCLPGKQAEPPEGPPLKGCIRSHIQVLCSLETRVCLCHSAPPTHNQRLVAATATQLTPACGSLVSTVASSESGKNPRWCFLRTLLRRQRHPLCIS